MPGEAGAVYENRSVAWDGVVIVDQEGEVGNRLVSSVGGDLELVRFEIERCVDVVNAEVVFFLQRVEPI